MRGLLLALLFFTSVTFGLHSPTGSSFHASRDVPGGIALQPLTNSWQSPFNISQSPQYNSVPGGIVVDRVNNVHMVWYEVDATDIFYAIKPVGGAWSSPLNISNTVGLSTSPSIGVDSMGNVYVTWSELNKIWVTLRNTAGTWTNPLNITSTGYGGYSQIAVSADDTVHVVWSNGSQGVYYSKKPFGGNWSPPVNISNGPFENYDLAIAVDHENSPHVVWRRSTVWYVREVDGAWTMPEQIVGPAGYHPTIAIDTADTVHVAYYGTTFIVEDDIYYTAKPKGSSWWSLITTISGVSLHSSFPVLTSDGYGTIHAVWDQFETGSDYKDVVYSTKPLGGAWSSPVNISMRAYYWAIQPKLAVSGTGIPHVAYIAVVPTEEHTAQSDVLYNTLATTTLSTTAAAGWNMISLPLSLQDNNFNSVLGDNITPGLYVYRYNPAGGSYQMWSNSTPVFSAEQGRGYWVKVLSPTLIDAGGYLATSKTFPVHINPGWNMIGNPFETSVSWNDVQVSYQGSTVSILQAQDNNWVSKYLYAYNTSTGGYNMVTAPEGQLDPWKGYWVKSFVEADLIIAATP